MKDHGPFHLLEDGQVRLRKGQRPNKGTPPKAGPLLHPDSNVSCEIMCLFFFSGRSSYCPSGYIWGLRMFYLPAFHVMF